MTGNIKTILTPQRAYFNRNTRVEYLYGLGDLIESDAIFMKFVDGNDSIGIQASNPSIISRIFVRNEELVKSSGVRVCEITELGQYEYKRLKEKKQQSPKASEPNKFSKENAKNSSSVARPSSDVEARLRELKKLYSKKLISKAIYEKKQDEILSDF